MHGAVTMARTMASNVETDEKRQERLRRRRERDRLRREKETDKE